MGSDYKYGLQVLMIVQNIQKNFFCFNNSLYSPLISQQNNFSKIADSSGFSNSAREIKPIVHRDLIITSAQKNG